MTLLFVDFRTSLLLNTCQFYHTISTIKQTSLFKLKIDLRSIHINSLTSVIFRNMYCDDRKYVHAGKVDNILQD
jgi:hypothetical protein